MAEILLVDCAPHGNGGIAAPSAPCHALVTRRISTPTPTRNRLAFCAPFAAFLGIDKQNFRHNKPLLFQRPGSFVNDSPVCELILPADNMK